MLIFHEGLPGSGKSYETLVEHIVPSLSKGRKVFARINGLNFEQIAELANIDVETCKDLLIHIEEDKVAQIPTTVENDSMVIIDEIQNFFPSGRAKVADDITKFVAEHRHRGLDIVVMGQSIADVNNLWRRRTQRKIQFLKMDMIGQVNRYKWTAYQGTLDAKGEIRFNKVNGGIKKYDKKYFGSYASHQSDTENTDNLVDKRLNIFNTPSFKYGVPAFLIAFCYAIYFLVGFFDGSTSIVGEDKLEAAKAKQTIESDVPLNPSAANIPVRKKILKEEYEYDDFLQKLELNYSPRLTYIERYKTMIWDFIVIYVDGGDRVQDRFYRDDLLEMGYELEWIGYGVKVSKGDFKTVFRMTPSPEPVGRVSNNISSQITSIN
jgi:zona occludens toxin